MNRERKRKPCDDDDDVCIEFVYFEYYLDDAACYYDF